MLRASGLQRLEPEVTALKFIVVFAGVIAALVLSLLMLPFVVYWGLGIAVPAIVVIGMPARVLYMAIKATLTYKALFVALLVPWAVFLRQVIEAGWITRTATETGPTVNPVIWACIGVAWMIVEALSVVSRRKAENVAAWERIRNGS